MSVKSKDNPVDRDLTGLEDAIVERDRPQLPEGEDYWVFGYGSLMWNPGFAHVEVRQALLYGYHRRFCVFSHRYRGTIQKPGLVLGLDRGGCCHGMVYRVPAGEAQAALDYLWEREMITGVYHPLWKNCKTDQGEVTALTFVVEPSHLQYTGRMTVEQTAKLICQGVGQRGTCKDYLCNTNGHLEALGIHDRLLRRLMKEVGA
ncbi:gamma-glutamylcyclotransferase [Rhodovibrionaceae bacterium A322]